MALDIAFCQAHLIVDNALAGTNSDCGGLAQFNVVQIYKKVQSVSNIYLYSMDLNINKLGLSCAKLRFSCASQVSFDG